MLAIPVRARPLVAVLFALAVLLVGLAQPGPAHAATCANADTPFTMPTPYPGESQESWITRYSVLQRNVRGAIVCLTNNERAMRGLPALIVRSPLSNAAQNHAAEMVRNRYFSHTGSNGSNPTQRVLAAGYCTGRSPFVWENIYYEYPRPTARSVVGWWMSSPGHRANILDPSPRDIGVGAAFGTPQSRTGGTFVQDFGLCR